MKNGIESIFFESWMILEILPLFWKKQSSKTIKKHKSLDYHRLSLQRSRPLDKILTIFRAGKKPQVKSVRKGWSPSHFYSVIISVFPPLPCCNRPSKSAAFQRHAVSCGEQRQDAQDRGYKECKDRKKMTSHHVQVSVYINLYVQVCLHEFHWFSQSFGARQLWKLQRSRDVCSRVVLETKDRPASTTFETLQCTFAAKCILSSWQWTSTGV